MKDKIVDFIKRNGILLVYLFIIYLITGFFYSGNTRESGRNASIITDPLTLREKNVGDSIIMSVVASGNSPLSYQWEKKNGIIWEALNNGSNEACTINAVTLLDDGIYRVRVWDTDGADTSKEIVLYTYSPPIVTSHPINDTVLSEQVASFSINASGNNLTYQWQKESGNWINIDGAVHSIYSFQVSAGDDNLNIRCIVSSGSFNNYSLPANVIIGSPVNIPDLFPVDTVIPLSDTITLSAQANGIPTPEFEWFYIYPSSQTPVSKGTGSKLSIFNTGKSDSGIYYFLASNKFDTSSSDSLFIHIAKPVVFSLNLPTTSLVQNKGEVVLSVEVEGDGIITYEWYKNKKILNNQTSNSVKIGQIDSSIHHKNVFYYCLVENKIANTTVSSIKSNICTLMVSSYYNPFKIKAELIDKYNTSKIRIKQWSDVDISGFPASKSILQWADSIFVMYKTNGYAENSKDANILLFSTQNIRSIYPDTVIDTINITPLPLQNDSSYWFTHSVLWHLPNDKDTLLKPFTDANRIFMIDTVKPSNSLLISGEYINNTESVILALSNISKIDKNDDSLVIIECSDYDDFSDLLSFKRIPVSSLIAGGDKYSLPMQVGKVPFKLKTVHCRWKIMSKNKCVSIYKSTSFSAGQEWIEYEGTLNADSTLLSDEIKLWWNKPDISFDSIRIWWDTDTIPLFHEFDLPISQVLYLSVPDTVDTLGNLTNNTLYHFGLQIYKDGMWSYITENSRTSATTAFGDTTTFPNVIIIDKAWFHDTTNKMHIEWHIDSSSCPEGFSYQFGYTYNPDITVDYSVKPLIWEVLSQENNVTVIDPGPNLIFDTVYTVGMWLRCYNDSMAGSNPSPPTESSVYKIKTPPFTWQVINLFPRDNDIVFAAGNKIVFHKITSYYFTGYSDTIWSFNMDTLPAGFVNVGGISFSFGNKSPQIPPFIIGLKYDSLPPGIKKSNLGLYRYIDEKFHVFHGFNVSDSMVWDTLNYDELAYPFFILADTIKPSVVASQYSDTVNSGNGDITTEFSVSDNIANVKWQFMYNSGDLGYAYDTVGFLDTFSQTVNTLIKGTDKVINQSFGTRAIMIVNDGASRDTLNVSRQVRNETGEFFGLRKNEWSPLRVTSHLDDTTLEKVFYRSFSENEKWEYDNRKLRLFRWYNNNPGQDNRWVEYSKDSSSGFFFKPGVLIWCKTAEGDSRIEFGKSITVSLKEPYEIELKPLNWTDIAHPFQFEVLLKDILIATGPMSDSIDIQHWRHNGKTSYDPYEIYNSILDSTVNITDTIKSKQWYDGYTVYNHSVNPVILKIPPIPLSLSNNHSSNKSKYIRSNERWDIEFKWRNKNNGYNTLFRNIRCGYLKRISDKRFLGPLPPSFSKIKVGIRDSLEDRICGYAVDNSLKEGGVVFEIAMTNNSDRDAVIEYFLGKLTTLPDGIQARILDPEKIAYENCDENVKSSVDLKTGSVKNRLLVVGNDNYFSKVIQMITPFRLAFLNAYPNPFRGALKLQFTIPAKMKEVQFTMFNAMGKTLWKYRITNNLTPGTHTLVYNSDRGKKGSFKFSSGIYILRLTATNNSNKVIYGGKKRLIFIK